MLDGVGLQKAEVAAADRQTGTAFASAAEVSAEPSGGNDALRPRVVAKAETELPEKVFRLRGGEVAPRLEIIGHRMRRQRGEMHDTGDRCAANDLSEEVLLHRLRIPARVRRNRDDVGTGGGEALDHGGGDRAVV